MARTTKKQKELTLEEKLEQSLVPVEEQPYPVPENWCWCKLGNIAEIIMGQSPKGEDTTDDNSFVPLIGGAADMGELYPNVTRYTRTPTKVSRKDDVIVCIRATLGQPIFSDGEYCLGRGVAAIRSQVLVKSFLRFLLITFENYLYENATGTTFVQVTGKVLKEMPVPLPPLSEQQRIVDCIESLFSKLDEAKAKAQSVIDTYEDRKSVILHQAFTGELTKEWRKHRALPENTWKTVKFQEIATVKSNLVDPQLYPDYPHIAPDNIEKKTGQLLTYRKVSEDKVKSGKHRFYPGQILYSKIRPYLSKVVIVDFDGLCSADMYPIETCEKMNTRFLWYYMLSDEFLVQASNSGSRSVLPKINQKELAALNVRTTGLAEQNEVVAIIDEIFETERKVKESAEQVISQVDAMKTSILSRAFRGELGTNNTLDECAAYFLRKML